MIGYQMIVERLGIFIIIGFPWEQRDGLFQGLPEADKTVIVLKYHWFRWHKTRGRKKAWMERSSVPSLSVQCAALLIHCDDSGTKRNLKVVKFLPPLSDSSTPERTWDWVHGLSDHYHLVFLLSSSPTNMCKKEIYLLWNSGVMGSQFFMALQPLKSFDRPLIRIALSN